MNEKIAILRCTKVEFYTRKNGQRKVIAEVSQKDGKVVVESEDKEFQKKLEEFLNGHKEGFALRFTEKDVHGYKKQVLIGQRPGDPFFLEALCGPWNESDPNQEMWGYTYVFARRAGKIWEEEVPKEMIWKEKKQ